MKTFIICQILHGAMFDHVEFPAWVWPGTELHDVVEDYIPANLRIVAEGHEFYAPNYNLHGSESYRVYTTALAPESPRDFAEGQAWLVILERNDQSTWVREIL